MAHSEWQEWLGRTQEASDNLDQGQIEKIAVTLDSAVPQAGDVLPLLWHWGLFVTPVPADELDADGYFSSGGMFPPLQARNRMWAGGHIEFIQPLLVGTQAIRKSEVIAINEKQGRSGPLLFITLRHEYTQNFVLCVREEQDYVYRLPGPEQIDHLKSSAVAEWSSAITPTTLSLFRYSALMFNSHRIHYDYAYATQEEGYKGLVVQGALMTTHMMQAFVRTYPNKEVTSLKYRILRPLIAPQPYTVGGRLFTPDELDLPDKIAAAQLWVEQDSLLACRAEVQFKV